MNATIFDLSLRIRRGYWRFNDLCSLISIDYVLGFRSKLVSLIPVVAYDSL